MSINNAGTANNSELFLSGGTTFAGVLNFGSQNDTAGGEAVVVITNATFYIGSGGVNLSNVAGLLPVMFLDTGTLGAMADWSSAVNGDGVTSGWLLGVTGDTFTIQCADANGVAHNITLSGSVGGLGNLAKTGGGTLTLGGINVWTGTTTVSAGTLALIGDGVSSGLISQTSDLEVDSPAQVSLAGVTNDTLSIGDGNIGEGVQTVSGNGKIAGDLHIGTSGTLAPGTATPTFGNLTVTSNVVVDGAVSIKIDHTGSISNDEVTAHSITIDTGSTLTVTQTGTNDLVTGDTFKLFSVPSTGEFTTVNLPVQNASGSITYVWTNKLAVNGTIVLLQGGTASAGPSTNRTTITSTFNGNSLQLSWPPDHLGWALQTNSQDIANPNDWHVVIGSTTVTNENITLNHSLTNVYFRLALPR